MQTITIEAQTRELSTRGELNILRKEGWVPAVVYGGQQKSGKKGQDASGNVLLKINEKSFLKSLGSHGKSNLIIELKWGKDSANAVIKELQRDPVSRHLVHVDFKRILMTEKIEVSVPIHLAGEAPGVKLHGGILEHISREAKISALPKDIPEFITLDISNLNIGEGFHVRDLPALNGVQYLGDPAALVVHVVSHVVVEETPAVGAAPATAEPEVIAKGKKPEEGEEGAAAAPAAKGGAAAAPAKGAAPAAKPAGK